FVIYPDAMDIIETNRCLSYHQDIVKKKIISSLDGIISFADLYFMVEEKVLEHASTGKKKALQGTAFEEWLVDILNHPSNMEIWNGEGDSDLGFNYPFFEKIISSLVGSKPRLNSVSATNSIENLPPLPPRTRGGKPKTDVL